MTTLKEYVNKNEPIEDDKASCFNCFSKKNQVTDQLDYDIDRVDHDKIIEKFEALVNQLQKSKSIATSYKRT